MFLAVSGGFAKQHARALGAILAHSVRAGHLRLRKGVWLDAGHIAALAAAVESDAKRTRR